MAFDRPLEADRVDDLGLLSTFVRAPIVGPIMWILGKKLGMNDDKDDEDKENNILSLRDTGSTCTRTVVKSTTTCTEHSTTSTNSNLQSSKARGSFPDMASSTISDITINSSICEDEIVGSTCTASASRTSSSAEETKSDKPYHSPQKKSTRKMSWSDESGQSLVEYYDMSQSSSQNPPPAQPYPTRTRTAYTSKRPIKSAMRRNINNKKGRAPFHPSQCVPSGLAGGSIVMPTGGGLQQQQHQQPQQQHHHQQVNSADVNVNGYISPQYGWYISMTPPTPPHYHDSSSSSSSATRAKNGQPQQQPQQQQQHIFKQHPHHQQILPPLQMIHNDGKKPILTTQVVVPQPQLPTRPVFTRSLKGIPNNTSGWPSVPL